MRFEIGSFLIAEGERLSLDLPHGKVKGFSRLQLIDGATTVELDAEAHAADPPTFVAADSTISFDPGDIASQQDLLDSTRIDLKQNRNAFLSFHWPNPLSPRSAGLFFRLALVRISAGYQLSFREITQQNPPADSLTRGYVYFNQEGTGWEPVFLRFGGPNQTKPLSELRDAWVKGLEIAAVAARSLRAGALLSGDETALIERESSRDWWFVIRLAPAVESLRLVAEVNDGSPGQDRDAVAVSARALRLEERADLRPRPLWWRRTITLECASFRPAIDSGAPVSDPRIWFVDWRDVPTFAGDLGKDHFSLRSFWQELARHWPLGLRSLRSRNALTFLPTDLSAGDPSLLPGQRSWSFRFRVERTGAHWSSRLVQVGGALAIPLRFELGSALDIRGLPVVFEAAVQNRFDALTSVSEPAPRHLFRWGIGPSRQALGELLVGGVLLDVGELDGGDLEIAFAASPAPLGQPPLTVRLELQARGLLPRPGTEDPERGFETENDLLGRQRPLVIDLGPEPTGATAIEVREEANTERSRVLEVTVRNAEQTPIHLIADVAVLDPGPFLVARVKATTASVQPQHIIASYRDDGERPAGWEMATETGEMTLILPPQAIGEEMIKGNLTVERNGRRETVPFTDRPFDFRLSPPAQLDLDRTDVDTARAAAPWTLRRLLDRREGVVGLKLVKARFELLYGLTAQLDGVPGLRIAEQDAFVGRVPLAPALRDRLISQSGLAERFPADERAYAETVVAWVRSLFARPAQMPVFRDFAARERLILSDGLDFAFRPSRQTADPLRIKDYHPDLPALPAPDAQRFPVRGGVDYPFESQNIYDAVLDTGRPKALAGEAQGHVAGLVFGALGGSGSQQASFDQGLTLIISETTHGRLNTLTLVRVGRIAMLWHHARHVIVYERTTRTAPRYVGQQPKDFEGLAALRKVKEYIEITQPRRGYPDLGADPGATDRPLAGPLTAGFFETTVIPVKSSWGRDIEDGWVMALRGPLSDAEAPYYPFPKIFLELARAQGKGGGVVSQLASDPAQLLFFTTTRAGLGGDPDAWPAWPDVDFPLTRRPQPPKLPFLPGFSGTSHQPDAADHDYGQRRFSIDVVPAEEAVDLMHGRPGNGLEARVRNVSLLRGGPASLARSAVEEAVGIPFAETEARIRDGLAELAQHLERLAQEGAGRTATEIAGLREQARVLLDNARQDGEKLKASLDNNQGLLEQQIEDWAALQQRRQQDAGQERLKARERHGRQLQETLQGIAASLPAGPLDLKLQQATEARLRGALESVCRQAEQRLEGFPFLPAEVLARLDAELGRAEAEVQDFLAGLRAGWIRLIDALAARSATTGPGALEVELFDTVLAGRSRVTALAASSTQQIKDRLGPLFGDRPGGALGRLTTVIEQIAGTVTGWIDETLENIPPFETVEPDWPRLRELFGVTFDVTPLFAAVRQEILVPLKLKVDDWQGELGRRIDAFEEKCHGESDRLVEALGQGVDALRQAIGGVVSGWLGHLADAAASLEVEAKERFDEIRALPIVQEIENKIDRVQVVREQVLANIEKLQTGLDDATQDLRSLADQARGVAQQAGVGLRRIGEEIEQAVTRELRATVEGAAGAALELARALAEGPVTDTLRCTRDWVGYYYDAAREALDVTRAAAVFNNLGAGVLNSLSAQVPFDRIRDRLLAQLKDFDLNKLFPDFAGLKLENLLGGLRIPDDPFGEYDWIKMRHGFDKARLTAWSEVVIDKQFEGDPELFTLPPVTLKVERPRFTAKSRVEASREGVRAQLTEALLVADWTVTLNGQPVMTIAGGGLFFDSSGGFRFDFEAQNLRLAPALQFVTDAIRGLLPPEEGLTLTPLFPGGVSVELSLPLPDIGTGAFTMTGITLYCHFDLLVAGGFEVRTGAWLSRPERPFGLAVLFLGGGGWFGVDVRYKPPREFETRVSLGISAGAFVALNFGVARGSAGLLFTAGLDFYRNWLQAGTQDLAISIGLLVWGEFSILSIVSAYLRIVLRIEYRNGAMTGYGNVSVSIKICWCFTLRVNRSISLPFKAKGGGARSVAAAAPPALALAAAPARPAVQAAVAAHFANLDL